MKSFTRCLRLSFSGVLLLLAASMLGQNTAPVNTAQPAPVKSAEPASPKTATAVPAATDAKEVTSQKSASAPTEGGEILIGPGDLLKVSVLGAQDFDQEVRVAANGNATLALIGSLHIAGLSTEQAGQLVRKRLMDGGYFSDPQVAVFQKEYATQGVSVLGEVQHPGVYPLIGPHHLFDLLSQAGGTTPKASTQVSITHQNQRHAPETVTMSNDPNVNNQANVEIRPGDTVVVSKAGIVYVVGDVRRPSGFVMENNTMTVLQAIAMAEGTNPTASLNNAKIVRRTPTGPEEIHLELKKMLAAKAPDLKLEAEDIVFVPSSAAKSVGERTLQSIVNVATGMAVYRLP
jgi:polysaccharide export outer membrane protein